MTRDRSKLIVHLSFDRINRPALARLMVIIFDLINLSELESLRSTLQIQFWVRDLHDIFFILLISYFESSIIPISSL